MKEMDSQSKLSLKLQAYQYLKTKILNYITIIAIVIISIFIRNITGIMCNEGKSATLMVLQYTFGMLMAGAVGNLIDRVVNGSVVDFICFEFIDFPIFNVADCYVTVSCVLIVVMCLLKLKEEDFNKIFTIKKNY